MQDTILNRGKGEPLEELGLRAKKRASEIAKHHNVTSIVVNESYAIITY